MAAILFVEAAAPAERSFLEAPLPLSVEVAKEKQCPVQPRVVLQLEVANLFVVVH